MAMVVMGRQRISVKRMQVLPKRKAERCMV